MVKMKTIWCRRCGGDMRNTNPHDRFYCPRCGEVRCGYRRRGQMIVAPHYRNDQNGDNKPCVGGLVDSRKDRAP